VNFTATPHGSAGARRQLALSPGARSILAGAFAGVMLGAIGWAFWHQDWQYSRPTPRPPDVRRPALASRVALPPPIERLRASRPGQPMLLHFFNPACPCSRFNVDHVRALETRFRSRVLIVAVLGDGEPAAMRAAYDTLALDVPHYVDADRHLARALGVYATPQAAVLDAEGRLYYQGNYNRTRYCRDHETEYARLALDAVLAGEPPHAYPAEAETAYGCPLPAPRAAARSGA
jgi:hypothetical protein